MTGGGIKIGEEESFEDILVKVGLIKNGEKSDHNSRIGQWRQGWGNGSTSKFVQIHEKIEQLSQWN